MTKRKRISGATKQGADAPCSPGTIDATTMDRFWLLTWTTYGSWLPGDERGFVSGQRNADGDREIHNIPGTPYDADVVELRHFARTALKSSPIYLTSDQALELLSQFQETAKLRKWLLLAVAVMANHVHMVLGVPGDPDPATLLRDFKSYGSRRLNGHWGTPESETWWTVSGSRRKLANETAVEDAIEYVRRQHNPLAMWIRNENGKAING